MFPKCCEIYPGSGGAAWSQGSNEQAPRIQKTEPPAQVLSGLLWHSSVLSETAKENELFLFFYWGPGESAEAKVHTLQAAMPSSIPGTTKCSSGGSEHYWVSPGSSCPAGHPHILAPNSQPSSLIIWALLGTPIFFFRKCEGRDRRRGEGKRDP